MTLVVALGCREFVVQVSDRRFTSVDDSGRESVRTDEGNKAVVVTSPALKIAVSFAGLAAFGQLVVGDWLLETVKMESAELGLAAVVEDIRHAAEGVLSRICDSAGRPIPHAFILSGFELRDGVWVPACASVTNCGDARFKPEGVNETFTTYRERRDDRFVRSIGCSAAIPNGSETTFRALLRRRQQRSAVSSAVDAIRKAARHRDLGRYVGENCTSICISRHGRLESTYHARHGRPISYGPNIIESFGSTGKGAMMFRAFEARMEPGTKVGIGQSGVTITDSRDQSAFDAPPALP